MTLPTVFSLANSNHKSLQGFFFPLFHIHQILFVFICLRQKYNLEAGPKDKKKRGGEGGKEAAACSTGC